MEVRLIPALAGTILEGCSWISVISTGADGSLWSLVVTPVMKRLADKKVFACVPAPGAAQPSRPVWVDAKEALFFDIDQDTEVRFKLHIV